MSSFSTLFVVCIVLGVQRQFQLVSSDCNVCSKEYQSSCISKTEFRLCNEDVPSGEVYSCAEGMICSILGFCQVEAGHLAGCDTCEKCDATRTFACLDMRTFALCLGNNTISDITGICAQDYICSIDTKNICGPAATYPTSCATKKEPVTTTTTTPSPQNTTAYCDWIQKEGRFPVGNDVTTTCKQYIRCYKNGDGYIGVIYYCPNGAYFDTANQVCSNQVPAQCGSTVRSLKLFGRELG